MSLNIRVVDFAKICRTCLKQDTHLKKLFPNVGDETADWKDIRKMLASLSMYPLLQDDKLPTKICGVCVRKLRDAYLFKEKCDRSYETLKSLILNSGRQHAEESLQVTPELVTCDVNIKTEMDASDVDNLEDTLNDNTDIIGNQDLEYKCLHCTKMFSQDVHLRKHMTTVHPDLKYYCNKCNKNCGNYARLKKHISVCRSNLLQSNTENFDVGVSCPACFENFESPDAMVKHVCKNENKFDPCTVETILNVADEPKVEAFDAPDYREKEEDADTECIDNDENPNEDFDDSSLEHRIPIYVETSFQIPLDTKDEYKTEIIKKPIKRTRNRYGKIDNVCEICEKTFSRPTHLKRHMLTHTQEKPFSCKECNKSFSRADHLRLHKYNHATVKPFVCSICNRGFVRMEHLKRHEANQHTDREKHEFCPKCGKGFTTAKYLAVHMRTHTDRKWKCKFCPEEFDTKAKSSEHAKTHAHEKPFLCSECGLRFVRNDYLIIHMRRHKGEKPYKCKFCEKGFPRATDLNVHERYHTGEKTHLCTICGKGFQRAYNLLVHNRIHTGEKPYKCPHCPKSFTQGNDLKSHIRRHTGERFKCDVCDEGFIQAYHLTQHKRDAHGIDTPSHIRRVAKFVTPTEQQKAMEAIRQQTVTETTHSETEQDIQPEQDIRPEQFVLANIKCEETLSIEEHDLTSD